MQSLLPALLCVLNPLLQDPLRLLHKLPVKINCIRIYTPRGVILAEDEIRSLLVIRIHLSGMLLAFLGELVCSGAIAALVRLVGLDVC